MPRHALVVAASLLLVASAGADGMRQPPAYDAADLAAPPVTLANLLASERFWPYHVSPAADWPIEGRAPLRAGLRGVLVRVEPAGLARIDFGRDGIHEIPVEDTDLLAGAEAIRRGERRKILPNLVHAIGPRLIDPTTTPPAPMSLQKALDAPGFVSVFASPDAPALAALAEAVAPLAAEAGFLTAFFPQGRHPDGEVFERLRTLGWPTPFVMDWLSEGYTQAHLGAATDPPRVLVQTPEGRVLFRSEWREGAATDLAAALARTKLASAEASD